MDELVMNTTFYKLYDNTGSNPYQTRAGKAEESFGLDKNFGFPFEDPKSMPRTDAAKNSFSTNPNFKYEQQDKGDQSKADKSLNYTISKEPIIHGNFLLRKWRNTQNLYLIIIFKK